MIRLGVSIDHVATLREARGARLPDPLAAAHAALLGGADQITMHLYAERRGIQDRDVELVRERIAAPLRLVLPASGEMTAFAARTEPAAVCLVPERGEGGLDTEGGAEALAERVAELKEAGIHAVLRVEPDERALLGANAAGADAVELHAARFAGAPAENARVAAFLALTKAANTAHELGLRVHAGGGLDYADVGRVAGVREIEELNVGYAIVTRALFVGLTEAVRQMRTEVLRAREAARAML